MVLFLNVVGVMMYMFVGHQCVWDKGVIVWSSSISNCQAFLPGAPPSVPVGELQACQWGAILPRCFATLIAKHPQVVRQWWGRLHTTPYSWPHDPLSHPSSASSASSLRDFLCLDPVNHSVFRNRCNKFQVKKLQIQTSKLNWIGGQLLPSFSAIHSQVTVLFFLFLEGRFHAFFPRHGKFDHDHRVFRGWPQDTMWPEGSYCDIMRSWYYQCKSVLIFHFPPGVRMDHSEWSSMPLFPAWWSGLMFGSLTG